MKKGNVREMHTVKNFYPTGYIKSIRLELKKVIWPDKPELVTDTVVVISCVAVFAVSFWLIDTVFLACLKGALEITLL